MAGDACEVRVKESLKIKIAEAKNLPQRSHGTPSHRDTYCVLSLDQEEIFRTGTIDRTLHPFYGEEFQFEIPRSFRYLSIYLFDRDKDRHLKQDKVLGKVAIRREELQNYNGLDYWFALQPVDADSEVQGKAHIEILFENSYPRIVSISPDYQQDASSPSVPHRNFEQSDGGRSPVTDVTSSNSSVDRKTSKSKKITEYCKENIKFGSCSSTSSKKLLSTVTIAENLSGVSRSDSLRSGQGGQGLHHTYGPSSSSKNKQISMNAENLRSQQSLNTFIPSDTFVHPSLEPDYSSDCSPYSVLDAPPSEGLRIDLRNKLSIRVIECSGLTMKNGQCDPYAVVTVTYGNNKEVSRRTEKKKKTVNPKFDHSFVFDSFDCDNKEKENTSGNAYSVSGCGETEACEVSVSLWHYGSGGGPRPHTFLGEVRVPLRTTSNQAALNKSAWYCLRSRNSSQQCSRGATPPAGARFSALTPAGHTPLGSLRLLLHHTLDRVLPPIAYDKLKNLLLKQPKSIITSAVYILGEIVANKADVAQPLVRLLTHEDMLVPVIKLLADAELATLSDATTIFRGNTLVSKMMDEAMRLTGSIYLQQTLKPVVDAIMTEKKVCEIDPTRVKDPTTVESNLANLKDYVAKMLSAITTSFVNCPAIMCRLFDVLRQSAVQRFPNNPDVKYSVISGFIFLRFFAPAILGPRLFDLTNEQIDIQTNRTLTLVSKTIQSLGNLTSSQVFKEEYMVALYRAFCTEAHIQSIKSFLEIISSSISERHYSNTLETSVLLKEGTMIKMAQNRKRFGRGNLKQRHFRLTSCELTYSKARGKKPLCSIPLTDILMAGPVPDQQNIKLSNMFQIKYKDRILYVQAGNCVERSEWLFLLGRLCVRHHPGTYTHSRWTCCLSNRSDTVGCAVNEGAVSPSSPPPPPNLRLHLDPARDLQRLHCLNYSHLNIIESLLLPPKAGSQQPALTASVPYEDLPQYQAMLKELLEVTYRLEEQHRIYQRSLVRETKYGSKQAPIGDDNYLNLGARPNMPLDSHQIGQMLQPSRMFHSATSPALHTVATSPPSSRHFKPYLSPSLTTKFDKPKLVSLPSDEGITITHTRESNLQSPASNSLQDQIFTNTDSTYLNNSLYNNSSTESVKIQDSEEKLKGRLGTSSSSGYLKMSSLNRSEDNSEESKVRNIRISPTQELIRKERISPPVPEQKPTALSEYVEVRPKVPERDTKPIPSPVIPPKSINKAKAVTPEEQIECPQFACAEYELMSDFSSALKNRLKVEDAKIDDTPPAVPPRSHYGTPMKFPPKTTAFKHLQDTDEILMQEYKSLEQYQLKSVTCADGSVKHTTTLRIVEDGDDEVDGRGKEDVQQARSQSIVCDASVVVRNSDTDVANIRQSQNNVTNVTVVEQCKWTQCSDSVDQPETVQQDTDAQHQTEEMTGKKQKIKDDTTSGFFSRKNVQRKSIPKSKKLSTVNVESSSSSTVQQPRRSDPIESSMSSGTTRMPLTDRLTPSFFKKKTKVATSTDNVRLPPIC